MEIEITGSEKESNRTNYSCLLSYQAFDLEWGWRWPCCNRDQYLFSITARQFTFEKQQDLYHNKVTLASLLLKGLATKHAAVKWIILLYWFHCSLILKVVNNLVIQTGFHCIPTIWESEEGVGGCLFDTMALGVGTYLGDVLLFLVGFIFVILHFNTGLGFIQAQLILFPFYFLQANMKL